MFNLTHRPTTFQELIGNTTTFKELLARYPDWPHTFLIIGPPGIGKTTLGRIIAKQVQCDDLNIREIDAGQDRGIDKIRKIIEDSYNRPLIGTSKVYIFDEAQGLTAEAQQALLKVTEEPPKNTYFIFCSTDPQKISTALKSRCKNGLISLNPLDNKEIGLIIKNICEKEGIKLEGKVKDIAKLCVYGASGIPRDAVTLFNHFYQYETVEDVEKELKGFDPSVPEELWDKVNALDRGEFEEFLKMFSEMDRGNFESFRITFGNVFKKKLLKAMITGKDIDKYRKIVSMFKEPVDNSLGDIELIYRFSEYLE